MEGDKPAKKKFSTYPLGYFHIDIAEVRTEEGKRYLLVAIDCRAAQPKATKRIAAAFLHHLIAAVPYTIHTLLSDNGIPFTHRKEDRYAFAPILDRACYEHGIEQRLTKVNHPWTNGQVERMNRTLKEATVKRYDYQTHQQLKEHLFNFLNAYHFAKRLKTLKGLSPYEYIIKCWQNKPQRFKINPNYHTIGLNI